MKIRNGFVSNSSSSSFTLFGWEFDGTIENIINPASLVDNAELVKRVYYIKEVIKTVEEVEEIMEEHGSYELGEFLADTLDISVEILSSYCETVYIGITPSLLGKNVESVKLDSLFQSIRDLREKLLNSPYINQSTKDHIKTVAMAVHSECWMDN